MNCTVPESAVRYWSETLAHHTFGSEQEARSEVFRLCENHARQSWSTPEGKNTCPENRKFATAMPVYQQNGRWKVGRPLDEYLSANTSDFSDGTNGGPTGYPPSGGSAGSAVGLPDYKYLERKKRRHDKLRALMQRRDPDKVSTNLWDKNVRSVMGEQRLSREEMTILKRQTRRRQLRVREDEEIDPKDVQFEPLPDYEQHTEEKFGWALNLGSQQEIEQRAEIAGIRLTSKTWDLINVQYYDVERNVVFYLGAEGGLTLRDEGHSDEDLVGSGWILPAQRPKLWHLLSNVPERTYINLLDTGYFTGLTPDRIFGEASKIMHKLLVPMFYVFDMQPVIPE